MPAAFGWSVLLALVGSVIIAFNFLGPKTCNVPVFLEHEIKNKRKRAMQYFLRPRQVLIDGYKRFGNNIWGIETSQGTKLVLPLELLDELKSHPALSFTESISNDAMMHYTGVGGVPSHVIHAFKAKFNPTLAAYTPILHEIIEREVKLAFAETNSWTETQVYEKMLRIVGIVSARAFYSDAASKDPAWLTLAPAYVETVIEYLQVLKQWSPLLRPVIRFFLPQRTRLIQQWNEARAHLLASMRDRRSGQPAAAPPSLFDILMENNKAHIDELIYTQMALVVAGIHTTAAAITQALYDLAVHPEMLPELREEVTRAYRDAGGSFSKQSLALLWRLDSFMKESQRLSSADLTTFQRMALRPLTLKNGLHIPKATKMEIATAAIHSDETHFYDAQTFDGLRFYKMRQRYADEESKHQYISTGKSDLAWGYGRHACPGRFLADIEIKLVLTEFLMRFEVKNPVGQPRHANIEFETSVMPDPSKTIMIRSLGS